MLYTTHNEMKCVNVVWWSISKYLGNPVVGDELFGDTTTNTFISHAVFC